MKKQKTGRADILMGMILIFTLTACIDPIAFEAEDKTGKLVIYGSFTDQYKDHEVSIRRTDKFGSTEFAVQGAMVEITDDENNKGRYFEAGEGTYVLPKGAMNGIPGKAYKLIVSLENNSAFESSWEVMPATVPVERTYFEIEFSKQLSESNNLTQKFFVNIFIDSNLKSANGSKAHLRWETEETFSLTDFQCNGLDNADVCYYEVPSVFGSLEIFSATDNSQTELRKHKVYSRSPAPYIEFNELHYFIVSQYSMSEATYDYWEKINIVSNPTGSIFDKVPAGVSGNFSQLDGSSEVLGYFEVASVSTGLTVTTWQEVNSSVQIPQACSVFVPWYFQPDYCCYCNLLPNTIPKPEYWGQR